MRPLNKPNEVWMPFLDKAVEGAFMGRTPAPVERNPFELLQNIDDLFERELAIPSSAQADRDSAHHGREPRRDPGLAGRVSVGA